MGLQSSHFTSLKHVLTRAAYYDIRLLTIRHSNLQMTTKLFLCITQLPIEIECEKIYSTHSPTNVDYISNRILLKMYQNIILFKILGNISSGMKIYKRLLCQIRTKQKIIVMFLYMNDITSSLNTKTLLETIQKDGWRGVVQSK